MSRPDHLHSLGFIGGTGPLGKGLAVRWALAGHEVLIGSRKADRAEDIAAEVRERAGEEVFVEGVTNDVAAGQGEVAVVTVPYEAQAAALGGLVETIGDKIVINVVNPMTFDDVGAKAVPVEAGSAAEECQELLPDARVVSAFHDVPAKRLWDVGTPVDCDVLICGDDDEACHLVAHFAASIPGMWGVNCGPLRNSQHIENMTPVLLFINRHYKIHAGLKIDGFPHDMSGLHAWPQDG